MVYVLYIVCIAEYLNKKSRLHTTPWYCPCCFTPPYATLSDKEFAETVRNVDLKRYFKSVTDITSYKSRCSVCTRKITKNQNPKSLPCMSCQSLVHRKCSNISLPDLLNCKPSQLKHWSCNSCMSESFPFQETETYELQKLSYNGLVFCPCLNQSVEASSINCEEFKLNSNLYDSDSIFTHAPDPQNNIDFNLHAADHI